MMCMSLSTNLSPSFMVVFSCLSSRAHCSPIRVRRLLDSFPEDRVVAGKDLTAHEPRDRLQLSQRVQRQSRVPDDAGHALLVGVLVPVAGIAGQDERPCLGQLDQ